MAVAIPSPSNHANEVPVQVEGTERDTEPNPALQELFSRLGASLKNMHGGERIHPQEVCVGQSWDDDQNL